MIFVILSGLASLNLVYLIGLVTVFDSKIFPKNVCDGSQHCYRHVLLNNGPLDKNNIPTKREVILDFNKKTEPDIHGKFYDKSYLPYPYTLMFSTARNSDKFAIFNDYENLISEAVHNGKNPELKKEIEAKQAEVDKEMAAQRKADAHDKYLEQKSNAEIHLSYINTDGKTITITGYCLGDAGSPGTAVNGVRVCEEHTTFSKEYPPETDNE
jgi:hypothetical protein